MNNIVRSSGGWIRLQVTDNTSRLRNILRLNTEKALNAAGQFCVNKMNEYVPVDTGYLRSRNDYRIRGGISNKYLELINQSHYAGFVEFGTRKMRAQPFMKPALYNHIAEIQKIVGRRLADGII